MILQPNSTILFQGDSITDAGRSRENLNDLGVGYPYFIAAHLQAAYPELNLRFINRGISGNRVVDLQGRWKEDALDLKPNLVSILIGINDTWRSFDSNDPTGTEAYETGYRDILTQLRDKLGATLATIIMIEPFVLPYPADREAWRTDLDPKIASARKLAREFNAIYIPMDGIFASVSAKAIPAYWASDGVHPTAAGHALIAKEWIKAVEG